MRGMWLLVVLMALPVAAEPLFLDVTAQAGVSGGGHAAWGDYDGDGWVDVLIGANLHHNEAGKAFVLVNEQAGLTATGDGGVWGDCDNDGDLDLFLWDSGGQLFLNDGDGTFTKGVLPPLPEVVSRGACWADLNGDTLLDLYVGGYEVWQKAIYPDVILYNTGGGVFVEHWRTPDNEVFCTRGVTAADYDEDGDLDVYVSNYRLQPNLLWQNDGQGNLTDVAVAAGVAGKLKSPLDYGKGRLIPVCGHTIGSAWGDLDSDGHLDLFVGNFSHPPAYQDRPQFLRNVGGPDWKFADMSANAGLKWQESFASPALADFDNDGDLDLYFTTVYKGDHSVLYRNDGNWRFTDVTAEAEIVAALTYQNAWADYDNDGDLDLMTGGKLYQNQAAGSSWLKVRLTGPGSAIGAQVRLRDGERVLTRQVEAGTGEGNQNDLTLHFGLGTRTRPVELEVLWPGGERTRVSTEINRLVTIRR